MDDHREQAIQDRVARLRQIVKEFEDDDLPVIGHFEVVPVDGQTKAHYSILWDHEVTNLFRIPEYRVAGIFAVLGSEVRLAILRELTAAPRTAAQLVEALGFRTTGQAYHHLRELQTEGYIDQKEGGRFHLNTRMARIYFAALALAWNAGAAKEEV